MAQNTPVSAACVVLAGTADGFDKETAVSRAQLALDDYIKQYKAENHLGAVAISAMRAEPQPYWRGRVSENMMIKEIATSAQAAQALKPIVGEFAFVVFALGIVGTVLLAVPVLTGSAAYGLGEAWKWPTGLSKPTDRSDIVRTLM